MKASMIVLRAIYDPVAQHNQPLALEGVLRHLPGQDVTRPPDPGRI
jgi:hypothetical protein